MISRNCFPSGGGTFHFLLFIFQNLMNFIKSKKFHPLPTPKVKRNISKNSVLFLLFVYFNTKGFQDHMNCLNCVVLII